MKILLVDDSRLARNRIKGLCAELGLSAEFAEAGTAEDGWDIAKDDVFDLAMVDYNMPGENGEWLLDKLCELDAAPRMALCTANTQNALRERMDEMGIAIINKPVDAKKLRPFVTTT